MSEYLKIDKSLVSVLVSVAVAIFWMGKMAMNIEYLTESVKTAQCSIEELITEVTDLKDKMGHHIDMSSILSETEYVDELKMHEVSLIKKGEKNG